MIRILGTIFAGLLGLAFGSFLNVCLSRWPEGESVVRPRSHCRHCSHTLAWWENVPLVSWIALRGRCSTCRAWIGWRYPLVELALGGIWGLVAWRLMGQVLDPRFGFPSRYAFPYIQLEFAIGMMIFYWVLVGLAVLDAEHLWLPDVVTLSGIALGIAFYVLVSEQVGWFFVMEPTPWKEIGERMLAAAAAAGLILLIRWVYWLIRRREGIGLGDAKLMALLAAWLGLPGALLAFGLGIVLGALAAVVLLAVPSARRDRETWAFSKLPLGTFLCIGGIVSSLWGQPIIAAYLRWAGF
ncbi:MAG: prepilin peptidase [Terracidiphilus sp.]|jgi:leader peptidase (prepilin peptidase)/N-methyltransferase